MIFIKYLYFYDKNYIKIKKNEMKMLINIF